jgi:hypothetical protein
MVKNVRLRSERGGDVIQVYTEDKALTFHADLPGLRFYEGVVELPVQAMKKRRGESFNREYRLNITPSLASAVARLLG